MKVNWQEFTQVGTGSDRLQTTFRKVEQSCVSPTNYGVQGTIANEPRSEDTTGCQAASVLQGSTYGEEPSWAW